MKLFVFILASIILLSCGGENAKTEPITEIDSKEIIGESHTPIITRDAKEVDLNKKFDSVALQEIEMIPTPKDSIIYHICYALDETTVIAVAQPMEDSFEGVRLQLLSRKNNKVKLIDSSSPGYDSPMLFPTFFRNEDGQYFILANTGENDSWGVKVYSLIDNQFSDVGFIDMAVLEKRQFPDDNGRMERYTNISKNTNIINENGMLTFTFNGNKLILFDDNNGKHDVKFKASDYYYTFDNKSLELHSK